jgi:hypothetical protein
LAAASTVEFDFDCENRLQRCELREAKWAHRVRMGKILRDAETENTAEKDEG